MGPKDLEEIGEEWPSEWLKTLIRKSSQGFVWMPQTWCI